MFPIQVPPHVFQSLYRHYKSGAPTNKFLQMVLADHAFRAAEAAEPGERLYLADILLFNYYASNFGYAKQVNDPAAFDLKWEAWRIRFSPDAEEIQFNPGDDDD